MERRSEDQPTVPPRGWRVAELSQSLGIPKSSIYRFISRGELPVVRYGTSVVVLDADLQEFLARRRVVGPPRACR